MRLANLLGINRILPKSGVEAIFSTQADKVQDQTKGSLPDLSTNNAAPLAIEGHDEIEGLLQDVYQKMLLELQQFDAKNHFDTLPDLYKRVIRYIDVYGDNAVFPLNQNDIDDVGFEHKISKDDLNRVLAGHLAYDDIAGVSFETEN